MLKIHISNKNPDFIVDSLHLIRICYKQENYKHFPLRSMRKSIKIKIKILRKVGGTGIPACLSFESIQLHENPL